MQLRHSTWPDIEAYLKRSRVIVIPVGSTEQHGPTGLLGTDAICPETIAWEAGASGDFLVGPTLSVGVAQHHMAFPGTISLRPSTMIRVMLDWMDSLHHHGFRKFLWFNGHGGNIATLNAAFAEFNHRLNFNSRSQSETTCYVRNWWDFEAVKSYCAQAFPIGDGVHATASEISVTMVAQPGIVKHRALSPELAEQFQPFSGAKDFRLKFPDGRVGSNPSLSNENDGNEIIRLSSDCLRNEVLTLSRQSDEAATE